MRNKYWAREIYGKLDPVEYNLMRFTTKAGKLIDEAEKKTVLELIVKNIPSQKGGKIQILDVATGPGRLAFFLEDGIKYAEIIAIDINRNMLRRAEKIAQEKKSRIKFLKGDIYHLPFKDKQFDIVVGLRYSMHLPDIPAVLKEFSRILRKDGLLIFDIFNTRSLLFLKSIFTKDKDAVSGWYSVKQINDFSARNGLNLVEKKGILLLGETLIRKFPEDLLFLFNPIISPVVFKTYTTKIILCFKKR